MTNHLKFNFNVCYLSLIHHVEYYVSAGKMGRVKRDDLWLDP